MSTDVSITAEVSVLIADFFRIKIGNFAKLSANM